MTKLLASRINPRMLRLQVRWLIMLRWIAGLAVVIGALINGLFVGWYEHTGPIIAIGLLILSYNAVLLHLTLRRPRGLGRVTVLAWLQVLADLALLAVLTTWTGGIRSPLLGFFVFHMVFASLLLSPAAAYLTAVAAIIFLTGGLEATGQLIFTVAEGLAFIGWSATLVLTVLLTNHITTMLHRHQERLADRSKRVRALLARLRRQRQQLVQHEKAVAMGQMVAGVNHEIANPLASIDSLVQLMQRNERFLTPERVATIGQQVDRIKATIRQLSDFAHPTDYAWRTVKLNEVAESALQVVRLDRRRKQIQIDRDFRATCCTVRIQPHAIQQALVNLLLNAVDAVADRPGPRVTIVTCCDQEHCRIEVIDNGPGIPDSDLPHLFEPFFTTKPVGQGTGLGLAVSQSLVRNQGGRIEVDSQTDRGTRMSLCVPRSDSACPAPDGPDGS